MKVCLVANSSIEVAPYVKKYCAFLDEKRVDYDVIYKMHIKAEDKGLPSNHYVHRYRDALGLISKFRRFVSYAVFVKRIIRSKNYDRTVFFTGLNTSMVYMVFGGSMKKIRYCVDIRDYDKGMDTPILKQLFRKAVRDAQLAVISSGKFKEWLPQAQKVCVMHNTPNTVVEQRTCNAFKRDDVTIAYFGGIGYLSQNIALVESLKNASNMNVLYRGVYPSGYNIRDYCIEHQISNVTFEGRYDERDKVKLYEGVDIINAVYGNDSKIVTTALPNKLYDCVYYKIPLMACAGTYLAEVVERYTIGFAVEPKTDNILDSINRYVDSFNRNAFETGCRKFISVVEQEQKQTMEEIEKFLKGEHEQC